MKTYLIILLLFIVKLTFAQDNNVKLSKPINSGFVFIDGKYIEPPYYLTIENNELLLNDYYIFTDVEVKLPYSLPDSINTGNKFYTFKLPNENEYFFSKVLKLYYSNFPKHQADELLKEYISNLPIVKKTYYNDKGMFTVEWTDMVLPMTWVGVSNSISKSDLKKINKSLQKTKIYIDDQLNKNKHITIFNGKIVNIEDKGLSILIDTNQTTSEKINKLKEMNIIPNYINIDTLKPNRLIKKVIHDNQNKGQINQLKNK